MRIANFGAGRYEHRDTHLKYSSTVAMALGGADSNCL